MICPNCKAQISDEARFCPSCGDAITKQESSSGGGEGAIYGFVKSLLDSTKNVKDSTLCTVEGVLSIVLAAMIVFAPVIKVDYYFGSNAVSMLTLVTNLSKLSNYLGKYSFIGPLLAVDMIFACLGIAMNAKQAFKNELTGSIEITKDIKIPNAYPGAATVYALSLIIILMFVSSSSRGIVGASGWTWLLLFGGIACQVVHFIRWSRNTPRA